MCGLPLFCCCCFVCVSQRVLRFCFWCLKSHLSLCSDHCTSSWPTIHGASLNVGIPPGPPPPATLKVRSFKVVWWYTHLHWASPMYTMFNWQGNNNVLFNVLYPNWAHDPSQSEEQNTVKTNFHEHVHTHTPTPTPTHTQQVELNNGSCPFFIIHLLASESIFSTCTAQRLCLCYELKLTQTEV